MPPLRFISVWPSPLDWIPSDVELEGLECLIEECREKGGFSKYGGSGFGCVHAVMLFVAVLCFFNFEGLVASAFIRSY